MEWANRLSGKIRTTQKILQGSEVDITEMESDATKLDLEKIILETREEERRKIARDIHDGPAQSLAAILLELHLLTAELQTTDGSEEIKQRLSKLQGIAKDSMNELRQILYDLRPIQLNDSLRSALQDHFDRMKQRFGLETEFRMEGVPQIYPEYVQIAIFRLIQEALTNIIKHAGVKKAYVSLDESEEKVSLIIQDEGNGFEKDKELFKSNSYGIVGMRERTALLGGTFDILSKPDSGTQILIEIPLKGRHYIGESKSNDSR